MAKTEYYIPMEVDGVSIKTFHIAKSDIEVKRIGNRKRHVIMVPATEEQYEAYMRSFWDEDKREQRTHKCILTMPDGSTKRCDGNCKKCKMESYARKERNEIEPTGRDFFYGQSLPKLSLESLKEDYDYEPGTDEYSDMNIILTVALFEQNLDRLKKYHPDYATIFEKLYNEESEREIAEELGISQSTLRYRIKKMREFLQRFVRREDIIGR